MRLEKALWFEVIRNKFMSQLAKYSEDELEERINRRVEGTIHDIIEYMIYF